MLNEAETRAEHIDPALAAAGWGANGSRVSREYVIAPGRIEGPGLRRRGLIADYVLVYRSCKLAVIEAKAWDRPLTEGLSQAKDYADKISVRFTYSSNGQGFYQVDMVNGVEGPIATFPSPDELWALTYGQAPAWETALNDVPFESRGGTFGGRYYQDAAVERVVEAIADGRKRILLTLATGTGKTFIAFQIAWKLFSAKWNLTGNPTRRPRILFLADRNILADQAFNAFSAFDDDALVRISPADIRKKGSVPKNGSVFFTIFQTFMSSANVGDAPRPYFGDYPPDFFDFIIVDECHRGGASDESEWRGILEYFAPAVQLGLTATPRRTENIDTYAYFGDPVYTYSLKDGINDGYLTPFRVKQIQTTIDEYVYSPDDEVLSGDVEANHLYTEGEFNRSIVIDERERKRVEILMNSINQSDKTLVFCANQAHAAAIRDLINQMKTSSSPHYCHRVTADDQAIGEQHLRDFQDDEKTIPTILTTSKKLSTGVDAPQVRNIVLLRPVRSMVEFKQIIGRGTRLFEQKDYFTIYDFVGAHRLFADPEWDGEPVGVEEGSDEVPTRPRPTTTPPDDTDGATPPTSPEKVRIRLADGKERELEFMIKTTFWGPDGQQMSSGQFLAHLFGELPDFFKDEDELRKLWSRPDTREELLSRLGERGFSGTTLLELQKLISAEKSDLYDVLAYVRFARPTVTRQRRAEAARHRLEAQLEAELNDFIDFVLEQYVAEGVHELALEKLPPLLQLRYGGVPEAISKLHKDVASIREAFVNFQHYLYEPVPA